MNSKLMSVALASMMTVSSAFAANTGNQNSTFGDTYTPKTSAKNLNTGLEVTAGADIDILGIARDGRDTYERITLRNAFITMKANVGKNFVAKITTELNLLLLRDGNGSISFNHVERWVKEAQIVIKDIGGVPFAILVGKGEVPFAQNYSRMPMHDDEGLGQLLFKEDQKFMVALKLDKRLLKFLDSAEVALFESDFRRDLDVGSLDGVAVRITKQLARNVQATGSWMMKGNDDNFGNEEHRVTLGVIYEDGSWAAWAEGQYIDNNFFLGDRWALITGVAKKLGFAEVAAEFQWLEDYGMNFGAGINVAVAKGVKVGPQVNYIVCDDNAPRFCRDTWKFGARVSVRTDNQGVPAKRERIGGKKYAPIPMN